MFYFLKRKHEKQNLSKKRRLDIEEKFLAFKLLGKTDKLNLIKMIIEKDYECKKNKDSLIFNNNEKTSQILLCLEKEKLTQNDLINLTPLREKSVDVLLIVCEEGEEEYNEKIL